MKLDMPVVMTIGIDEAIKRNARFRQEVLRSITRYVAEDFSDMEFEEDIQANRDAIKNADQRILASYKTCEGPIWIITEWDRSATTILFPSEY